MDQIQFGKYIANEEIGRGGMSIVYKGQHPTLNKPVAIKVLSEFLSGDSGFIKRFQDEAQLLSSFRHANIVSILDYGRQDSHYFIVMDFIEGFTVKQMIQETGVLSLGIATSIVKNVATALAYTHRKSIIHQDIKCSNIMVDNNGRILVTDFGLSRNISIDNADEGAIEIAGTLSYSAPEQLDRKQGKLDARTDIYALGVVFYEMVTGELPFADENTTVNIAYQHLNVIPESPKKKRPDLLLKSSSIIMKMLKKKQDERYQSMDDLLKDLNELEDVLQYYRPDSEEEEGSYFAFQPDEGDDSSVTDESQAPLVFSSTEEKETVDPGNAGEDKPAIDAMDSDPFIGKEIKHRYRIQKLMLRRILSRLYYGVDLVKDVPVTIQLPNEARPTFKTRINKEVQTMQKIDHPGFVRFIDVIEENGVNFVIREFVDGHTVKNLLKREKLSIKKSVQIVLDVLDALGYLHKKGIIHRDLNSDVVIVPKEGNTRISSLGFTRVEDASSVSSGEFLGVVQYTAPEQITQSNSDVRTDLYAVGILLFEMLTGSPPFDSPLPVEVMDMHLKRIPRFPEESQKGIPLTLQRIVLKALSKQPEQRFQTASEMANALHGFLENFTGKKSKLGFSSDDSEDESAGNDVSRSSSNNEMITSINALTDTGIYKNIQQNRVNKKPVPFSIKKHENTSMEKDAKVDIRKIIDDGLKPDMKTKTLESTQEREVFSATQKVKKYTEDPQNSPKFAIKSEKMETPKKTNSFLPVLLILFILLIGFFLWKILFQTNGSTPIAASGNSLMWISPQNVKQSLLKPLQPLTLTLKQPSYVKGNTFTIQEIPNDIDYTISQPDSEGNFVITLFASQKPVTDEIKFTLLYTNIDNEKLEEYHYIIANDSSSITTLMLNYNKASYQIDQGKEQNIETNVLLYQDLVYVPLRFLTQSLNGVLEYDFEQEMIQISQIDSHQYGFFLFRDEYMYDGITIDGHNPVLEINDIAYLPLDFLSTKMNFTIVLEKNMKDQFIIKLIKNKEV